MDRYEHLPIYKYDLTIYFEKIVRNFTRYLGTLWERTREKSRGLSGLISHSQFYCRKTPGGKTGYNFSQGGKVACPLALE